LNWKLPAPGKGLLGDYTSDLAFFLDRLQENEIEIGLFLSGQIATEAAAPVVKGSPALALT